ncbi:MAG: hypothetical protein JSU81_00185 [Candidatus Coatesbacteria bacterium]|nr:MAG: hypothetical protein JSU81_00185 [Candidatus Coatesbacteria bacterium]
MNNKIKINAMKLILVGVFAPVSVVIMFTGCLFSPPEEQPPEPPPEMDSPVNVLRNVEIAYNSRNIDLYKKALSPSFVFYFDPNDVGQSPPGKQYVIPESWSYTEDWDATRNMFNQAHSISLLIKKDKVGQPEPEATVYRADNVIIDLLVMVDELNGFQAGETGYCNYQFESYEGAGGKKLWRLRTWWDRTAG